MHGSQPKFTIPECVADMNRAVRYIRSHADDFKIDPNRIGITGASAGGHLSLMLGCAGDAGDPKAKDPVDRVSSRVQAVACFFPPTDFLNYGKPGVKSLGIEPEHQFKPPFDFREVDPQPPSCSSRSTWRRAKRSARRCRRSITSRKDDAPTLIIHGDADELVPLQQSELIIAKFKEAGVPAELVVKKGAGHGWATMLVDDVKTHRRLVRQVPVADRDRPGGQIATGAQLKEHLPPRVAELRKDGVWAACRIEALPAVPARRRAHPSSCLAAIAGNTGRSCPC